MSKSVTTVIKIWTYSTIDVFFVGPFEKVKCLCAQTNAKREEGVSGRERERKKEMRSIKLDGDCADIEQID